MIDSFLEDRERVASELQNIARFRNWNPNPKLISAIIDWHSRAVEAARVEVWVPGSLRCKGSDVEYPVDRFYNHYVKTAISRLTDEGSKLKLQLLTAIGTLSFYATSESDGGERAVIALRSLIDNESASLDVPLSLDRYEETIVEMLKKNCTTSEDSP